VISHRLSGIKQGWLNADGSRLNVYKKNLRIVLFRCIFEKQSDKTIAESRLQDFQSLQDFGNLTLLRINRATCKTKQPSDEIASPFRISNDKNKVLLPL